MRPGRRGFLEAAGLAVAGLWTFIGGLAKLNSVRALVEWLFSWRAGPRVVDAVGTITTRTTVLGVGQAVLTSSYVIVGEDVTTRTDLA